MGNKIAAWIITNWKDITMFGAGCFAVIRGAIWAVKKYKKIIAPVKAWIKKMEDGVSQLDFNGGLNVKDIVYSTNQTVKRIERDLTVVKNRQTAMLELDEMPYFESNDEGYWIRANAALCTLTGATANQLLGYGWLNFVKNSDNEKDTWEQAIESDNEITRDYTILYGGHKDIEIRAKYTVHIKRDEQGLILNITGKVIKK